MKKIMFAALFLAAAVSLNAGVFIDMYGGWSAARMALYNDGMDEAQVYYEAMGFETKLKGINSDLNLGLDAGAFFDGGWAPYIRSNFIFMKEDYNEVNYPGGGTIMKNTVKYDCVYTGIGLRKYFQERLYEHEFLFFAAADAGISFSVDNYAKTKWFNPDGSQLDYADVDYKGIMFGAHAEAGCEYFVEKNLGFGIRAGYRLMSGSVSGNIKSGNVLEGNNGTKDTQDLEYSGIYVNAGITFFIK